MSVTQSSAPLYSDLVADPDMVELVQMFVEELPQRVEAIRGALRTADVAQLATLAHQLKGAAGGYGFAPITEAAAALEKRCKAGDAVEALALTARELAELCQRATAAVPPAP